MQTKPDAGDRARINELEASISKAQNELADLRASAGKIESAIEALEQKILDIGGSKLLTQKSKVDGIKVFIGLANDDVTKAEVAKAKAKKDSVKYDSSLDKNNKEMAEANEEIKKMESSLADIERQILEYQSDMQDVQDKLDTAKEALDALKQELATKTEEIQAFRQKEVRLPPGLMNYTEHYLDRPSSTIRRSQEGFGGKRYHLESLAE